MDATLLQLELPGERTAVAELFLPDGAPAAPGVLVVHEWWGLNDDMRRVAGRLAAEGFAAVALDLYNGRATSDPGEALSLAQAMHTPDAMDVVRAAVARLGSHPGCTGRIGITGFCLGGGMALAAACNVDGLSAAVPFYGIPLPRYADYSRVRIAVQGHYGKLDPLIPIEKPEAVFTALRAAGAVAELHLYDAGHAFLREGDPAAFHEHSAALAWKRMVGFLRTHLAGPAA